MENHNGTNKPPLHHDPSSSNEKAGDLESDASKDLGLVKTSTNFDQFGEINAVKQGLHQRHIQMIALAGTIGTGLFLGSGRALATSGPLGCFLAYSIIGLVAASVVFAVGEMGALIPLSGGVIRYSEFFVDPALSFAQGWNTVYSAFVSIPAEIVAAAVLVEFWITVNNAIWISVFGVLILLCALAFVRVYGELEFFFAILKILLIVGINIMALVITCGGAPDRRSIGFRYWRNPGPFVQHLGVPGSWGQFLGFWTTLNNAVYAYSSIETISVAAAEVKNPRRAIPQAAKRIFIRILLFYVVTIFMVGLVVPSNDPALLRSTGTAAQSPFVIAANNAGIKVVPSIINAVVLTSAWSAGNSIMLASSRTIYGLAIHGHAPKVFKRLNRFGVPWVAISLISIFMCLGYMTLSDSASTVFSWLQDLVAISTLVNWIIISITYLRFFYGMKKQGFDRKQNLPWAAPLQPYITWTALILMICILLTGGYSTFMKGRWNTEVFVSSYVNIPIILVLYFGYKLGKETKIIPLDELRLKELLEVCQADMEVMEPPRAKTGLRKLNILWN